MGTCSSDTWSDMLSDNQTECLGPGLSKTHPLAKLVSFFSAKYYRGCIQQEAGSSIRQREKWPNPMIKKSKGLYPGQFKGKKKKAGTANLSEREGLG